MSNLLNFLVNYFILSDKIIKLKLFHAAFIRSETPLRKSCSITHILQLGGAKTQNRPKCKKKGKLDGTFIVSDRETREVNERLKKNGAAENILVGGGSSPTSSSRPKLKWF